MPRFYKLSGVSPDIAEGNQGFYETSLDFWNVMPDTGYTLVIDRDPDADSTHVELWNWDKSVLVATASGLYAGSFALTPEAGQAIGMLDPALGAHLGVGGAGFYDISPPHQELRIPPLGDLPDINHPMYEPFAYRDLSGPNPNTDTSLMTAKASACLAAGTQMVRRLTLTVPGPTLCGVENAQLGDMVACDVDGQPQVGKVETLDIQFTPDGISTNMVLRFEGIRIIYPD